MPQALAAEQQRAKQVLRTLEHWGLSLLPQIPGVMTDRTQKRFRHSAVKLFDSLRAAALLKGGPETLCETLIRCLQTAAPKFMVPAVLEQITQGGKKERLPAPSLIRRYELSLDIALNLLVQERTPSAFVRFAHSDSSPMAGYDWLWMQLTEIRLQSTPLLPCSLSSSETPRLCPAPIAPECEDPSNSTDSLLII